MRTIPANTLAKLAEQYGTEPVTIVVVSWDRTKKYWYADRKLDGIHGKILTVSDMDTVINVSGNSDSEEVSIILDDTNGEIKTLMDNNDVHKTEAWVYQYFYGMDLDDKFLLFKGRVNSPIVWSEGDRTVSFSIVSQLEDDEVGFSPEEGQFENIADELIGKPWPMIFGSVTGARPLRITRVGAAITAGPINIPDVTLIGRIRALEININYQNQKAAQAYALIQWWWGRFFWEEFSREEGWEARASYARQKAEENAAARTTFLNNAARLNSQKAQVTADLAAQGGMTQSIKIIDTDSSIPTGPITIEIGGARFSGVNTGTWINFNLHTIGWYITPRGTWTSVAISGYVPRELNGEPLDLPKADGEILLDGSFAPNGSVEGNTLGAFYAEAGSSIKVLNQEPQKYIVSLTPGTVTRVSAYYNKDGLRVLTVVPDYYWTTVRESMGGQFAITITTIDALSKLGSWEDQIYVDFVSTIGPNTIEIMEYLIDSYSDLTYDTTTFDSVKTALANYPSNFVLYDRQNILDLLKDIAWQCRCSIRLINDIFYLTYLSMTPTPIETIDQTDILINSLELGYTSTEDLVTKMVCTWESAGFQKEKHRVILKNNVAKYGIQEQDYDFYIYNYLDAIIKSATFWLIRYSNTWRKATFITPITKLNVETLDAITLDVSFIGSSVTSIVESAIYDSANNGIAFECWLPILAGTTSEYVFAFPASADSTEIFQADLDVPQRYTIGSNLTQYNRTTNNPYNLKKDSVDRKFSTLGSRTPSDISDKKPNFTTITVPPFSVLPAQGPETPYYDSVKLETTLLEEEEAITEIDIRTTIITDSETGKSCTLDTFFDRIDTVEIDEEDTDILIVSATHSVVGDDDEDTEQIAQFHYRYYDGGEVPEDATWGAGTAFLLDDTV